MTVHPALTRSEQIAPVPATEADATVDNWVRHYAALGLAAHTAFDAAVNGFLKSLTPAPHAELGYLITMAVSSTAAVRALTTDPERVAAALWDLTPEAGALNGEYVEFLAETLDGLGVNPADIDPRYNAADFRSPSRVANTPGGAR